MTRDEVRIGNCIYWTLMKLVTRNNYSSLAELHTPKIIVATAHIQWSVFISCYLVAASNCGSFSEISPASGTSLALLTTVALTLLNQIDHNSKSKSKLCWDQRSVGQSVLLSSPIWSARPDSCYCQTVAGMLMCGALSDESSGLSFTFAAGPHQLSHSRIRVPRDS
jgi:hypothetical protein